MEHPGEKEMFRVERHLPYASHAAAVTHWEQQKVATACKNAAKAEKKPDTKPDAAPPAEPAPKPTTGGSRLGDVLPKNIYFQLLVRGRWWALTLSLCRGGGTENPAARCGPWQAIWNTRRRGGLPAAGAP